MKTILPILAAVGGLTLTSARAGSPLLDQTPAASGPAVSTGDKSEWRFNATTYLWLTAVDGDIGVNGITAPVDLGMDDVLRDLDFTYMFYVEAARDRWTFGVDGVYAELSGTAPFAQGPVTGSARVKETEAFVTGRISYRLVENSRVKLDAFAGVRWTYFDLNVTMSTPMGQQSMGHTEDFLDPVVGLKATVDLSERWYFLGAAEIGGFGVGSDLTWQVLGSVGYRINDRWSVMAGYRALSVDYEKDGFKLDTLMHGPAIGVNFRF